MDDYHIKMQAIQELKEALTIKRANEELLEYFASSLRWLIHYSEKNNIPLPEKDKIISVVDRAMELAYKIPLTAPTNLQQPDATTEEGNRTQSRYRIYKFVLTKRKRLINNEIALAKNY